MHPNYLQQVLRDRGVRCPPMAQLQAYAQSLTPEGEAVVDERLRRIAFGVDRPDDIDTLLREIKAAAVPPQQPAPQDPQRLPEPDVLPASERAQRGPDGTPAKVKRVGEGLAPELLALLRRNGMHVYGKSGALKIELGTLRAGELTGVTQYTVQIDAARSIGPGYDWSGKIPFQFTAKELPQLAAFLLGYGGKRIAFGNHGPNTDKHLTIEEQPGKLFVTVSRSGGRSVPVPVTGPDVFSWGELCLVALNLNRPEIGREGLLALLRRMSSLGVSE